MKFDALLFDFDGVLADTEPVHYVCWLAATEPHGLRYSWEYYSRNCIGVSDAELFLRWFKPGGADSGLDLVARKQSAFRSALEAQPPFLRETLDLIRDLALDYSMAVVSSSARTEIEPPLVRSGIRECFQHVITMNDVARVKPEPEGYLKAAALLGARRPLVIEDSETGAAAGFAAGFEVLKVGSVAEVPGAVRERLRGQGSGVRG